MLSFLNQPFPCIYSKKANFISAVLIGLFVMGFLLIFKPFDLGRAEVDFLLVKIAGFGLVSFFVMLFIYFVLPKIFPSFFLEKNYTIGKELLINILLVLMIGTANTIYGRTFIEDPAGYYLLGMIWNTFLVAIFPITFLTMVQYTRLLKSNIQASQEIDLPESVADLTTSEIGNLKTVKPYFITGEQGKVEISQNDLLFLESDGNYAHVHQFCEDNYSKTMYRTTLKSLEAENSYPNIIRCHRSYIVNLDQVTEVNGNAQGLKLSVKNCEETVPVSRKYINDVKAYFNHSKGGVKHHH